jgi:hypothetical protein
MYLGKGNYVCIMLYVAHEKELIIRERTLYLPSSKFEYPSSHPKHVFLRKEQADEIMHTHI